MGRTYRATGINLRGMVLGEHDRLLTILTREHGLVKAVAPGARKHRSSMAGRSGLFVVNDLLIASGKTLDRITQAETLQSFVGLGQNLAKLTAAQYLAEITLMQALSQQPQEELFLILTEHLQRLSQVTTSQQVLACLNHGVYHLLAIAGFAPQVQACCLTQQALAPDFVAIKWQAGFSIIGGGIVNLSRHHEKSDTKPNPPYVTEDTSNYGAKDAKISHYLNALELSTLQELAQVNLSDQITHIGITTWLAIEKILRAYAQYHFDSPIQSAALIDSCFTL